MTSLAGTDEARRRFRRVGIDTNWQPAIVWQIPSPRLDSAPRYLLRDRDRIFGPEFVAQVKAMGITQILSALRSPWQRAYVERLIGTIRRECPDPVIAFGESSLYRHVQNFAIYYHRTRTHLGLQKDTPQPRPIQPPVPDGSSRSRRWVASITVTSGARPNTREFPAAGPARMFIMSEVCPFSG
jgi:transposase InsO family protein